MTDRATATTDQLRDALNSLIGIAPRVERVARLLDFAPDNVRHAVAEAMSSIGDATILLKGLLKDFD